MTQLNPTYLKLTQGQVAKVCGCHAHLVTPYKWCVLNDRSGKFYAVRSVRLDNGKRRNQRMHAVINGTPKGFGTDHKDGDTLNNQCHNLRTATKSQNAMNVGKHKDNASGYKGVSWHKLSGKWRARIMFNGREKQLGSYDTPEAAYEAYCGAAKELHGEFGRIA